MALHNPPLEIPFIDTKTGFVTEPWAQWLIINKRDKANRIEDGTEDNIMILDDTGNPKDGSAVLPTGSVVGTSAAQTLTNKTITSPTVTGGTFTTPTITGGTITSPTITSPTIADLTNMTHDHKSAAKGGDYAWADMALAATQADASAISAVALTAGANTVDITACNATLATMRTEINAIVTAFNALIDKLQTAKLMT